MNPKADPPSALAPPPRKPRLSILIATAFGLGYLPKAPGTWGSFAGLALTVVLAAPFSNSLSLIFIPMWRRLYPLTPDFAGELFLGAEIVVMLIVGLWGVYASERVAEFIQIKDPQTVVIDEVSGMNVALLLGLGASLHPGHARYSSAFGNASVLLIARLLNWKYLLLGFILFRVFDIWKPFPVRQAERLSGGWGIMADDWVAAIYAALGLWLVRALGL